MLQVYISPSCSSCRKVKKYFDENNIKYQEKNIFNEMLTREDIFKILSKSENGFADIISTRSKVIKDQKIDINSMKIHELVDFIINNPSVLKRPIIVSDIELQIGYNDDDITLFLPDDLREKACFECKKDCKYQEIINKLK